MNDAIYFEVERSLKRDFNIALAKSGDTKTKILRQAIEEYVKTNG